nr:hypothetical protein Iba_chr04bCG17730 [Ipomoea batatas]
MRITGRVLLRLEKGIKIPKAVKYNIVVCRHLLKAHLKKYHNKIKEDLEQWMKMASFNWLAFSTEVVLFQVLPIATSNVLPSEVSSFFYPFGSIHRTLPY